MKHNLLIIVSGIFMSLSLQASYENNQNTESNLIVFLMQNNKILLQKKADNQWATPSSYCGEGGTPRNIALDLINETQLGITRLYVIHDNELPANYDGIRPLRETMPPTYYAAKVENLTEWSWSATYKNFKNRMLLMMNDWQSFEESNIPENCGNRQYLNKDIIVAALVSYKKGRCSKASMKPQYNPWDK